VLHPSTACSYASLTVVWWCLACVAAVSQALSALRGEVHGLRIALRILTLLAVSEHGLGLSEAHAFTLLAPEMPPRAGGAVWAVACEHVALFVGAPNAGVWSFPHGCVAAGCRAALLQNGPGLDEHAQLAQHYLSYLDPAYDGSFEAVEGGTPQHST
jgi:hypothetical protein